MSPKTRWTLKGKVKPRDGGGIGDISLPWHLSIWPSAEGSSLWQISGVEKENSWSHTCDTDGWILYIFSVEMFVWEHDVKFQWRIRLDSFTNLNWGLNSWKILWLNSNHLKSIQLSTHSNFNDYGQQPLSTSISTLAHPAPSGFKAHVFIGYDAFSSCFTQQRQRNDPSLTVFEGSHGRWVVENI